jgi:hypothetical protein
MPEISLRLSLATHPSALKGQPPRVHAKRPRGGTCGRSQDLRLTIVSTDENDPASNRGGNAHKDVGDAGKAGHEKPLDSIGEICATLRTCWVPPPKIRSATWTLASAVTAVPRVHVVMMRP